MATIGNTYTDIIDLLKATQDGKTVAPVIEVLSKQNPVLDDAVTVECNMGTIHRHTIRTGLPSVTWGRLYQGIAQSKGSRQQVDDTTGFVEALAAVDRRILDLKPNLAAQYRLSEAQGFLESMNQEMGSGVFYHNTTTTPEKFKGLAARYNTLANSQVVTAAGSGGDNMSIWFVTWGAGFTTLLHPENIPAGLQREDKGEQRVTDSDGNPYYVMEELFRWHIGVSVEDWRYNVRICNIDASDLADGTVDLYKFMRNAYYKLQSTIRRVGGGEAARTQGVEPVRQAIYCNRNALEALDALATNKGSTDNFVRLTPLEIEGRVVPTYRGIPIRMTDSLLNTETAVA
jgi:hypothetical protein